jgi:hypothetical protein
MLCRMRTEPHTEEEAKVLAKVVTRPWLTPEDTRLVGERSCHASSTLLSILEALVTLQNSSMKLRLDDFNLISRLDHA